MTTYRTTQAKGGETEGVQPERKPKQPNPNQVVQRLDAETVVGLAQRFTPGLLEPYNPNKPKPRRRKPAADDE